MVATWTARKGQLQLVDADQPELRGYTETSVHCGTIWHEELLAIRARQAIRAAPLGVRLTIWPNSDRLGQAALGL